MPFWWLKKAGLLLLFLWAAGSLIFFLVQAVPGDPLLSILGQTPRSADILRLQDSLKLNLPLATRYVHFMQRMFVLDFGESLIDRKPVLTSILKYLPNTIFLTLAAIMISILIAFPLAVMAVLKKSSFWEGLALIFSAIGLAVPSFLLGILLTIVFSVEWKLFPISGSGSAKFLVLPALTLGISLSAFLTRMIRAVLSKELQQPYVLLARAKGLSNARIYRQHVFKNAAIPIVTIIGLQLGALLSGAIIVESIFSWPGLGTLLITAIRQRDFPMIQGTVLFMAVSYLILNFLIDLSYPFFNPRIGHDPAK
ncbi:MAG: ABC transporter permease [Chrysiogenales bacterium]|nr:MAG: ABC transporter permease [Chrysiogenales bacterium]